MSWDVFCFVVPARVSSVDDLPDSYIPPQIGSRTEVIDGLRRICPQIDATDPTWVIIDTDDLIAEVSLKESPVKGITLLVRGGANPETTQQSTG